MANFVSENKKFKILELYFNGNDKRLVVIASIVGSNASTVSAVVQQFFEKKLVGMVVPILFITQK